MCNTNISLIHQPLTSLRHRRRMRTGELSVDSDKNIRIIVWKRRRRTPIRAAGKFRRTTNLQIVIHANAAVRQERRQLGGGGCRRLDLHLVRSPARENDRVFQRLQAERQRRLREHDGPRQGRLLSRYRRHPRLYSRLGHREVLPSWGGRFGENRETDWLAEKTEFGETMNLIINAYVLKSVGIKRATRFLRTSVAINRQISDRLNGNYTN